MIRLSFLALAACVLLVQPLVATAQVAELATADDVTESDYRIYRSDGTSATWDDIRAAMNGTDVVFVGELHNDPVSHKVEQHVLTRWFDAHGHAAALSLEMFSRDVQYIVDEYLARLITDAHFQQSSSPWSNYETDYRPLVEFAKENDLAVIAANAPRRYANMVSRSGRSALQGLSDQARSYLAPLPFGGASQRYEDQWNQVMAEAMAAMRAAVSDREESEPTHEAESHEHGQMEHGGMQHGEKGHGEGMDHGKMGEGHAGMNHEGMDHAAMRAKHHPDMSDEEYEKMKAEHMAKMKDGEGMDHGNMQHGEEGHGGMERGEMDHGEMEQGEMEHGDEGHEGMDHGNMQHGEEEAAAPVPSQGSGHGGGSMLDAQNLWDATMAWSIAEHMTRRPGAKVAHMVGGFHVETGTGTPEHLVQYRPGTRMLIISVQSVDDPATFDPEKHTGLGDFVVLGDASLPRTYETRTR